jgi:Bacterial membrane protein YfhO
MRTISNRLTALRSRDHRADEPIRSVQVGTASSEGSKRPLVWFAGILLAAAFTFDDLLTGDRVPVYRDLLHILMPMHHYLAEHLRRGQIPLWNPLMLMGTPFLANWQSVVLYPPSLLFLLPSPVGSDLFIFTHYVIALAGMWVWLRGRSLSAASAAAGSLTFALCGYLVSVMSVLPHLEGAAWAPWVLHTWQRVSTEPKPRRILAFVLALSLQMLTGSPENFLLTLVLLGGLESYRLIGERRQIARRAILLVASLALAVGIDMIQILPTLEYVAHSTRTAGFPFAEAANWSLQPISLLQLLFPHTSISVPYGQQSLGPAFEANLPFLQSIYLGVASLLLAVVGLVHGRDRAFWGLILAAGVILALGDHTPLFQFLYDVAPFLFARFRYPEKFFFIVSFATASLAAEGMESLLRHREGATRAALTAGATIAGAALVLVVLNALDSERYLRTIAMLCGEDRPLWQFLPLGIDVVDKAKRLLLLVAAFSAVLVLRGRALRPQIVAVLLVTLVAVDLFSAHRHLNLNIAWADLWATPLLVDTDAFRERHERIFQYQTVSVALHGSISAPIAGLARLTQSIGSNEDLRPFYKSLWSALPLNEGMFVGVANVSGGDAIVRASDGLLLSMLASLPRERAVELLRLCGVGYLIGNEPLDVVGVERVTRAPSSSLYVYRIPRPAPAVQLVSRLRAIASDSDALSTMTTNSFQAGKEAVAESLPPSWRDDDAAGSGSARLVAYADSTVEVEAKSDSRALLVLNDSFFPGWEATIDGNPTTIYRTNVFFRGVDVPAGTHRIEFHYRPRSFTIGMIICLATVGVLVVFLSGYATKSSPTAGAERESRPSP